MSVKIIPQEFTHICDVCGKEYPKAKTNTPPFGWLRICLSYSTDPRQVYETVDLCDDCYNLGSSSQEMKKNFINGLVDGLRKVK